MDDTPKPVEQAKTPVEAATAPSDVSPVSGGVEPEKVAEKPSEEAKIELVAAHSDKVTASPAVRARAKALGVDLGQVKASGGHVRHADLDAYLNYGSGQGYRAPGVSAARADESVKVIGMRRRIAENMAASKRNIPHFSYVEEFDVTALEAMRADLNAIAANGPS